MCAVYGFAIDECGSRSMSTCEHSFC